MYTIRRMLDIQALARQDQQRYLDSTMSSEYSQPSSEKDCRNAYFPATRDLEPPDQV